jgi:hypothetical protein
MKWDFRFIGWETKLVLLKNTPKRCNIDVRSTSEFRDGNIRFKIFLAKSST